MAKYSIVDGGIDFIGGNADANLPAGSGRFPGLSARMREAQSERGSAQDASPTAALLDPVDPTPMGNAPTVTIDPPFLTLGGETRVNTTTAGQQINPKTVPLANGGYVVVWGGGNNNLDILGQRYDASGQPVGSEFTVIVAGPASPSVPTVAALANGSFVVAWASGVGNSLFVVSRHYNASGEPLTPNGNIVNTSPVVNLGYPTSPDIVGLSDGSYVVTWITTSGDAFDIHGQRFNSADVKLGAEFAINTTTANYQTETSVAALPGGGFVVTWTSTGQDGSGEGVYGQRYGANGVAAGTEFRVNSSTAGNQYHAEVTALVGGGFLVTWAGQDSGGQLDIFAQRYDASGGAVGTEFRVNTTTTGFQNQPEVGALPDGGFIIAWSSFDEGTFNNVYAQRYNADGSTRGGEFRVNSTLTDMQEVQSIAVLQDGQIAIVWQSNAQDGSGWGVYSQRYAGEFLATEQVSTSLKAAITVGDDLTTNVVTAALRVYDGLLNVTAGSSGVSVSGNGTAVVTLVGTVAQINALLNGDATSTVFYFANSDTPPARTQLTVTVTDAEAKVTETTVGIGIIGTPELATAKNDAATTSETVVKTGNLFANNGSGADTSTGGQPLIVSAINNNSAAVGTTITLASGALLTVQADGSYVYNPNGQFTALGAAGSGASNLTAQDSFTYTLANGNTATVTLTITGVDNEDILVGTSGDDTLIGGVGADTINGGDGNDFLASYLPDGTFTQYPFNTSLSLDIYADHDVLNGGDGEDKIAIGYGDTVDGGDGTDRLYVNLQGATSGVTVDFTQLFTIGTVTIGGATITNIESVNSVIGSEYDDVLRAFSTASTPFSRVWGMGGNDTLTAEYYTTVLDGGTGNDIVDGRGSQYLQDVIGGDGDDTLYTNSNTFASAHGGEGNDTIYAHLNTYGGAGNDTIWMQFSYYSGHVYGEEGDDQIHAAETGNVMSGGSGADTITGGDGADVLVSGDFDVSGITGTDYGTEHDVLNGGGGNDEFTAGYGDDVDGGAGTNRLTLFLTGSLSGVTLTNGSFASGTGLTIGGGTIKNIQEVRTIVGSNYNDTITVTGQTAGAVLIGGGGNDTLTGASGNDTLQGDSGDDWLDGGTGNDTMTGGDGNDTFIVDSLNDVVNEVSGEGTDTVMASISFELIGLGAVENLTLTGSTAIDGRGNGLGNVLTGNSAANALYGFGGTDTMYGNGGDDIIDGGGQADTMYGGTGNDTYYVENAGDTVIELSGEGDTDVVHSFLNSYTLTANVEGLVLDGSAITGTGNASDNGLTGNGLNNALYGMNGNDMLWGEGGEDMLDGGAGADILYGGASNDTLYGGAGNDRLEGGSGADKMYGGADDDTYLVEEATDEVFELNGEGIDTVLAATSWVMTAGQQIEDLRTANAAGTFAINLTGNDFANTITGNEGANRLVGGGGNDTIFGGGGADRIEGGTGADAMSGGTGDDSYIVDDAGDTVFEAGGEGTDRVATTVSWAMAAGQEIEQLTVANVASTNAVNLTGNEFANKIAGNDGANTLIGGGGNDKLAGAGGNDILDGGTGADQMQGGTGSDSYIVDNVGDTVFEANSGGLDSDTVTAYVSWTLGAGQEVERLRTAAGTDPINLTGNELAQKIQGNEGANILSGGGGNDVLIGGGGNDTLYGGTGFDKMTGGTGADTFVLEAASGTDQITDFTVGSDKIDLVALGLSWVQVMAAMSESNGNTTLNLGGGNALIISGVASATLHESDFVLAAPPSGYEPLGFERGPESLFQIHSDMPTAFDWHLI